MNAKWQYGHANAGDRVLGDRGRRASSARRGGSTVTRPVRSIHDIKGITLDFPEPIRIEAPAPLYVRYLQGRGTRLVVSMAGVGRSRTGEPPPEFTGSASQNGENHVLFIADGARSWMNAPHLAERIRRQVMQFRDFHGITEVVALGNSMGGFAAIVLADLMPIDTVIAFVPQFSMHPELMPEETRWRFFAKRIDEWSFPTVGNAAQPGTSYFMFHAGHEWEDRHWRRIPPVGHQFVFRGMDHSIAPVLRKRQMLTPVVAAAIDGKPRRVRKLLQRSRLGRKFDVLRREDYEAKYPAEPGAVTPQAATGATGVEGYTS